MKTKTSVHQKLTVERGILTELNMLGQDWKISHRDKPMHQSLLVGNILLEKCMAQLSVTYNTYRASKLGIPMDMEEMSVLTKWPNIFSEIISKTENLETSSPIVIICAGTILKGELQDTVIYWLYTPGTDHIVFGVTPIEHRFTGVNVYRFVYRDTEEIQHAIAS